MGGGPGLQRGGSLVIFLQIGKGQTCFILNQGRITVFFGKEKLLRVASILYIQAKLPVKINLNVLQVFLHQYLYIKKLSSPRCFCLGISEGSCINPCQEVGGPQLFSQKNYKIPPPPPPNKKCTFS